MSLFPVIAPVAAAVTEVAYGSEAFDGTDSNLTPSFSGMTFGAAATNRYVFVVIGSGDSISAAEGVASVTIGGVAATEIVEIKVASILCGIWVANVPTGTTGTVAITITPGGYGAHGTGVSTLYAYGTNPTATDTASASGTSSSSKSVTIDIPAGGFVIAGTHENSGSLTHTWTNATEVADNYGDGSQGGPRGVAADNEAAVVSGRVITATPSSTAHQALVAASFGPA